MSREGLPIIKSENHESQNHQRPKVSPASRRKEAEAMFERMWLMEPEKFNSERTSIERERIKRTWDLILSLGDWKGKRVLDIGAGTAILSLKIAELGAEVDVVDISNNALKYLKDYSEKINLIQDSLPNTRLRDETYDLELCTDVIASLNPEDYRLALSELSRLLKKDGYLVCSTSLDFRTEEPLNHFIHIVETEFAIEKIVLSYNALYIRVLEFLKTPRYFFKSWKEPKFRQEMLEKRIWIWKWWWKLNSTAPLALFWKGVDFLLSPIIYLLEKNQTLLLLFEKICHFISAEEGISHVIIAAKKRSLFVPPSRMDARPLRKFPKWE